MQQEVNRRNFMKSGIAATAGAMAIAASADAPAQQKPATTNGKLPTGKIGDMEFSRLMLGGNLISGYSHSRDLLYVTQLMKHYFTPAKLRENLEIAEQNGIDSVNTAVWDDLAPLNEHLRAGGKMKWIVAIQPKEGDGHDHAKRAIDKGADVIYIQGQMADALIKKRQFDLIANSIDFIKTQGIVAGIGGHSLAVIKLCEENKIPVDFYQKTLHTLDYRSAPKPEDPGEEMGDWDNGWCRNPEEVIAYMQNIKKPWIAFKVMAAGAIPPRKAFPHALNSGADFILAGMFDWQIAEDVKIFNYAFGNVQRTRPWCA